MKNMRKFVKQNIKGFIVGFIVTGVGIVTASTIIPSNSVTYNNSSQNVTNVKEALDVLLEKANKPKCEYNPGDVVATFDFTGYVEEYPIPCSGTYKLEVWGAQGGGGGYGAAAYGSNGGYSYGNITLTSKTLLYVAIGGKGATGGQYTAEVAVGGFNGGGSSSTRKLNAASGSTSVYLDSGGSGGGATHISTTNRGVLSNYASYKSEVLIVAGGGAGGTYYYGSPGTGGGITGGIGSNGPAAGTQTTGYAFGLGGPGTAFEYHRGGGGGGGWYGGYGSNGSAGVDKQASGGSGYIGGVTGGSMTNGVQTGNGKAVITLVSLSE